MAFVLPVVLRYVYTYYCNNYFFPCQHFPEEGIHIISSTLHTHLLGVSAKVYHLRASDQCKPGGGIEELKPIDSNPHYDFNFQESVFIDEVVVKRVRNELIYYFSCCHIGGHNTTRMYI